jgi:hypothetical protein
VVRNCGAESGGVNCGAKLWCGTGWNWWRGTVRELWCNCAKPWRGTQAWNCGAELVAESAVQSGVNCVREPRREPWRGTAANRRVTAAELRRNRWREPWRGTRRVIAGAELRCGTAWRGTAVELWCVNSYAELRRELRRNCGGTAAWNCGVELRCGTVAELRCVTVMRNRWT